MSTFYKMIFIGFFAFAFTSVKASAAEARCASWQPSFGGNLGPCRTAQEVVTWSCQVRERTSAGIFSSLPARRTNIEGVRSNFVELAAKKEELAQSYCASKRLTPAECSQIVSVHCDDPTKARLWGQRQN